MRNFVLLVLLWIVLVGCGTAPTARTIPTLAPTFPPAEATEPPDDAVQALPPTSAPVSNAEGQVSLIRRTLPPTWTPTPEGGPAFSAVESEATRIAALNAQNQRTILTLTAMFDDSGVAQVPISAPTATDVFLVVIPQTQFYAQQTAYLRPCPMIAGDSCPPILSIPRGSTVMAQARAVGDSFGDSQLWYFVTYDGRQGYVHSALFGTSPYVEPQPTQTPQKPPAREVADGKARVYFFYADWCPYCRQQMPHMRQLSDEYGSGVEIDWLDVDDSSNHDRASQYGVGGIPHTVILTESGSVVRSLIGYQSLSTLRSGVEQAMSR